MKKLFVVLLACLVFSSTAEARHYHHGFHGWRRGGYYAADITAGIIGTTAGVLLAEEMMRPRRYKQPSPTVYVVEPEGKCYTIVSKKTGKVTQQCVENASDSIIYVD